MLTEDLEFPYGGYAKATVADLVEGDGVRFDTSTDPCWLVVTSTRRDDDVDLILTDRNTHVAKVFAQALARYIDGMLADNGLHARTYPAGTPCWIRL